MTERTPAEFKQLPHKQLLLEALEIACRCEDEFSNTCLHQIFVKNSDYVCAEAWGLDTTLENALNSIRIEAISSYVAQVVFAAAVFLLTGKLNHLREPRIDVEKCNAFDYIRVRVEGLDENPQFRKIEGPRLAMRNFTYLLTGDYRAKLSAYDLYNRLINLEE